MMERFVVGKDEKRRRWINAGLGLLFSAAMVVAVTVGQQQDPERYSSFLWWSVVSLLGAANLSNLVFLIRYLRLVDDHCIELVPGKLRFLSAGKWSELDLDQVTALRLFKRWGKLRHIQLVLKNNRGIRLEGYENLGGLADSLQGALPGKLMP
ncbi:hypothetical protein [Accumulibacter sp.]|uniref:hypothetical protein n=1 Tax=Accumulibacter sp. TaxID=2053492 RepID=UPI0025FCC1E8|nr:hypothetical protein [Accumulibacter sp.]MCP5229092.1 hypothetical protein [Accumulibacter sp.]